MSELPSTPYKKITRGAVVRLYPTDAQARVMDMWRNRARGLWNLLLAFQQAAYSGEIVHPGLRWRRINCAALQETSALEALG